MEHTTDDERGSSEPSAAQLDTNGSDAIKHNVSDPSSGDTTTSSTSETHDTNGITPFPALHPGLDTNADTNQPRKDRPISGVVPPYWRHQRALSRASLASSVDTHRSSKPAITLEDHTADPNATTTRGLWARSVTIDDHVVVSGKTGIGAYVVWMCNVQTLDVRLPHHPKPSSYKIALLMNMLQGGPMMIPMRYSEFDELRSLLATAFPHARNALPPLPPKSVLFKFRAKFLESRRTGLQYFLNCVLLNPEFSGSPVLKDFLFSRVG